MHFDTIVIGGGLSGLLCGLKLQRAGKTTAIVSMGQNAMHFSSGAFGLLSRMPDGTAVEKPFEAVKNLPQTHPYSKIGPTRMKEYASQVKTLFASCGVPLVGEEDRNSYMITPTGNIKAAWLALSDVTLFPSRDVKVGEKALIINLKGYLDFNTSFIAASLEEHGTACRIETIEIPEMERLRSNPSEMRSVNIARVLESGRVVASVARTVRALLRDEDTVILPSVFGLYGAAALVTIKENIHVNTIFLGTMPPSVPGIRSQLLIKKAYEAAGGTFMAGDQVVEAELEGDLVRSVRTANLGDMKLTADNFVLASGSFFSKGLWSTPDRVVEPLMGLDVDHEPDRMDWYDRNFFAEQKYIGFGVKTDACFHPFKDGRPIGNLYAVGAVIGECNSVKLGCGAGVAIMTALSAADSILGE